LVGLGGRLGVLCTGAVMDSGLRGMAVAQATDALERIHSRAPRVVIVPVTMARHERDAIADACNDVYAELVELAAIVAPHHIEHAIAKALAVSERRRQRISSIEIKAR